MKQEAPTRAVALTYDGLHAPVVSATGASELAEEILRIAREHEVPIYENAELVDILARLELGDEIPELLYRAIAEIIAFVYMLKGKAPAGFGQKKTVAIPALEHKPNERK
ncbi:MAG TPA: EscU/YscU/HrcU family type III secretion system export apparatus switch protein [Dongiaceae bacterium]|nr:EscU/YscU/HrcU family type III secretion system export apparatus switch protein [Dongiaceae bacterium]